MLLSEKHCVPCREGTPSLDKGTIRLLLGDVPGWSVDAAAGKPPADHEALRLCRFSDGDGVRGQDGRPGPGGGHHPDFCVHYSRVDVSLSTHAARGLTENDFILAAKLDALLPGRAA